MAYWTCSLVFPYVKGLLTHMGYPSCLCPRRLHVKMPTPTEECYFNFPSGKSVSFSRLCNLAKQSEYFSLYLLFAPLPASLPASISFQVYFFSYHALKIWLSTSTSPNQFAVLNFFSRRTVQFASLSIHGVFCIFLRNHNSSAIRYCSAWSPVNKACHGYNNIDYTEEFSGY